MRAFIAVLVFALFAALLPAAAAAGPLKAGVARVDITPPIGLTMYGYGGRKAGATGVRDPLMARVLVLEAGETRIAFVGLDLGEPPAFDWVKRLRENAAESSGISYVLVTATHTHAGPDIRPAYPAGAPPDWESDALARIGRAIDDAHQHAVESRIGTGYGQRARSATIASGSSPTAASPGSSATTR